MQGESGVVGEQKRRGQRRASPSVAVVVGQSQWLWRRQDRLEMCSVRIS